jgi:hypothetical protein
MTMSKLRSAALATMLAATTAVTTGSPASADGPTHSVEELEFTLAEHPYFTEVCGFPVSLHVWGSWNVVSWTDADGDLTKEIRNFRFRSTTTANGVSINGSTMGPEMWTYAEDGSSTGQLRGVVNRRIPGQGTVVLYAGYEIQQLSGPDAEPVVTFSAGPREEAELICSAFI